MSCTFPYIVWPYRPLSTLYGLERKEEQSMWMVGAGGEGSMIRGMVVHRHTEAMDIESIMH